MALSVTRDPELSKRTTLRLGGVALAEVTVEAPAGLDLLPETLDDLGGKPVVLGKGSNILATDGRLGLCLVRVGITDDELRMVEQDRPDATVVRIHAGTALPVLLVRLARSGLTGLEGLAGIPGTVGGAVAMNAGSFGHVMGDCVNRVQVWTREQGLVWYGRDSLAMGYRHFSVREVEGFYLLAQVELALEKEPRGEDAIRARMREAMDKKQALQPVSDWSAGCVFKNPEAREPAGLLLDRHGFRGRQLGGMVYSPMHANFLVNTGEGTSDQAFELIAMARDVVRQQEGINLELEVKVWESR